MHNVNCGQKSARIVAVVPIISSPLSIEERLRWEEFLYEFDSRMTTISLTLLPPVNRRHGVSFAIACLMVIAFANRSSASGTDTTATPGTAATKTPPRLLNGTAKDREQVTSSIRLVLPTPEPHLLTGVQSHVLNGSAQSSLLNGSTQSRTLNGSAGTTPLNAQTTAAPVKPVAVFNVPNAPRADVYHPVLPSRITVIPERTYTKPAAKWNYTLTPKNGIMNWSPGYASTKVPMQPHVVTPVQAAVKPVLQQTSVSPSMQQQIGVVPLRRPQVNTVLVQPSVNGAVQPVTKKPEAALEATAKKFPVPPTPPPAVALQATPKLLTEMHANVKRSINWDEWYKRVCRVVYDNWEIDQANPGKACVRVTVWSGREIEARVLSFTPAQGASRDVTRETAFRETSLRAINSLEKTPVLDFPLRSNRGKIIFDLDMNRAVNGPSGIQVAAFHDVEETTGPASSKSLQHASSSSPASARTATAGSTLAVVKSAGKTTAAKSAVKYSRASHSSSQPEPREETPAPNAFQAAAQSFASRAFTSSMDAANAVSKRLQFLRWKDPSAPAADSKTR